MKKSLVRFFSAAVAATMMVSLCCMQVFAAFPNANISSTFTIYGDENVTMSSANNKYSVTEPIEIEDDLFDKAFPYMWYGGGSDNRFTSYISFNLDMPERDSNDGIYVSFYYKSASEFVGLDGKTYTAEPTMPMDHIRDSSERLLNLETQGLGDFDFVADDQWHRIETYIQSNGRFADNKLNIYHTYLSKPMYVLFADIKVGVLDISEEFAFNNDQCYTEMGWFLKELGTVSSLEVNGQELDISGGQKEFTVKTADFAAPDVRLNGTSYITKKLADDKYEITPVAYAYNKALGDDDTVTYRERWQGTVYNSGSMNYINTVNGTLKGESYIINLAYDEGFYVDGVKADGGSIPAGTVYSYKKSFERPADGSIAALIAAYDKQTNTLVDVALQNYEYADDETIKHVSIDMNKDNSDDSLYFKVFMLDSLQTQKPLIESKTTASISAE